MQTAGAEKLLELRVDSKIYGSAANAPIEVLRDFVFRLATGSFATLVGPSGCGKTTILRIAAGLDRDFQGERRISPSTRVAMVFQEPRLLPWRTVEDNIRIAMHAASVTGDIGEWLERFDIADQRRQYAGELSLGQARRAAVARAMSIGPDLLLLDEPLVSLDDAVAARLRGELRAIADGRKVSILLATHDLEEAVELSDRMLFLDGKPARVILEKELSIPRSHRDRGTVAAFVEEIRMQTGNPRDDARILKPYSQPH
jgi:ABC-type nitrate/sulfonate/bicarbonate transport system ATPase subunit